MGVGSTSAEMGWCRLGSHAWLVWRVPMPALPRPAPFAQTSLSRVLRAPRPRRPRSSQLALHPLDAPPNGTSFVPVFPSWVPLISFSRGLSNPRDSHFQEGLLPDLKTYPLVS